MKKQFVASNNLQIAFNVTHPDKEHTIFFIHGNSVSSRNWRKQIENDLLSKYRLVTLDLPNHGDSEALTEGGDFSLPALAKIMAGAVNSLHHNKPYIICSVSLGTNIAVEMLLHSIEPDGMLLAGPCITGEGFGLDKIILAGADVTAVFAEDLPNEVVKKYAGETSISSDPADNTLFLEDYYAVKGNFRSSLYATIAAGNYNDEIKTLQEGSFPIAIVFGEDEKVVNTEYLNNSPFKIWNGIIYKIPGASHLVNIDAPVAFNELLSQFAEDIFTEGVA